MLYMFGPLRRCMYKEYTACFAISGQTKKLFMEGFAAWKICPAVLHMINALLELIHKLLSCIRQAHAYASPAACALLAMFCLRKQGH